MQVPWGGLPKDRNAESAATCPTKRLGEVGSCVSVGRGSWKAGRFTNDKPHKSEEINEQGL
jgi:hypothetical protein